MLQFGSMTEWRYNVYVLVQELPTGTGCRIERWGGENASEGLSKGLSWKQVAENLEINPDKVGLLVPLMRQPVLLKDLRIACGFTNSTKFKKRYIDPLLSLDLIAMTQPDKLTSPTQKYYLTEKGKISQNKNIKII